MEGFRARFRFWRLLLWRPWIKALSLIYGILSVLDFVRDKFVPAWFRPIWDKYYVLPDLSWRTWLIVGLAMALVFALERSYRLIGKSEALKEEAGLALKTLYDAGRHLRREFMASDETLTEVTIKGKYAAWRKQLVDDVTKLVSVGKAQYVDAVETVSAVDHIGIRVNTTTALRENLISHLDARLNRLAEILRDF